jgi:hypothetical protein
MKILKQRVYGQPKLDKPTMCNNKNLIGTIKFNKSCTCKVWKDDSTYIILHRDWFSESISIDEAIARGLQGNKRNNFVYNDNWGCVVLRNEALMEITADDLLHTNYINLSSELLRRFEKIIGVEAYSLERYEWCNFFEQFARLTRGNNV